VSDWAPDAGDLIWVEPDDTVGTEQRGRRPALVLSPGALNALTGRAVILPITSRVRGDPFETSLPIDARVSGVVLCDQIRTIDWRARGAKPAGTAPAEVLTDARAKVAALLGLG
jgi:mRNA interferase MazF